MKLLFISQYFYPESFKGNDIVFDLVKRGHEVTVLTAKPNYPEGKFFPGYTFFNKRIEYIQGAKVIRTPVIPRGNGKGIKLILNYLSFIIFSFFSVWFRIREKYDVVFVQQLSPVTMALPGILIKRKQNIPLCLWVLDLWPESVSSASKIKNKFVLNTLNILVRYIYKNSDSILISSEFFRNSINQKIGKGCKSITYFPNWAEDLFLNSDVSNSNKSIPPLPHGNIIMFAGNVGEAQDFESILSAAEITLKEKPELSWVIVGEGRKSDWLKSEVAFRKLVNVYILGRFPIEEMPFFFIQADIMLVSLKDTPALSLTVPAKIQSYMASSKIILGMMNGEGYDLINKSGCGFSVAAGDFHGLAEKAIQLTNISSKTKLKMEQNALSYYLEHFEKERLMIKLETELLNLIKKNSPSKL